MERAGPAGEGTSGLRRSGLRRGARTRAHVGVRARRPWVEVRALVGLAPREAGARVPVLERPTLGPSSRELRARVRHHRTADPAGVVRRRGRAGAMRTKSSWSAPRDHSASGPPATWPTTTGSTPRTPGRSSRSSSRSSSRKAASFRRASTVGLNPPTCIPTPRSRAASTLGRCSRRSTRWSGSGRARSGSSTSATASRSTRRSPSGSTATTCCHSCSGTRSSPAWTSRPSGPTTCCARRVRRGRPRSDRDAGPLAEELALLAGWLGLERVVVDDHGDLGPALQHATS